MRGAVSLVTFIRDRADTQPFLPHVVIASEHLFHQRDVADLRATLPGNLHVLRQKSGWLSIDKSRLHDRLFGALPGRRTSQSGSRS